MVIDYGRSKRESLSYPSVWRVGKLVGGQVNLSAPMNPITWSYMDYEIVVIKGFHSNK